MTEERIPAAVPTDITFPMYVTATSGLVTAGITRWIGQIPPELYLWIQLTVPLVMGWVSAKARLRLAHNRPRQLPRDDGD